MSSTLRSQITRLAHAKPEFRPALLPLIRTGAEAVTPTQFVATVLAMAHQFGLRAEVNDTWEAEVKLTRPNDLTRYTVAADVYNGAISFWYLRAHRGTTNYEVGVKDFDRPRDISTLKKFLKTYLEAFLRKYQA